MCALDQIRNAIPFPHQRDGDVRSFSASLLLTKSYQNLSSIDNYITRQFMKYLIPHPTNARNRQTTCHITYKQLKYFPDMKTTFRLT